MTWQDACALIDASEFASSKGWPLNTFITLVWNLAGPKFDGSREAWSDCQRTFVRVLDRVLGPKGIPVVYVFARENVAGRRGPHIHAMVYLPPDRRVALTAELSTKLMVAFDTIDPKFVAIWKSPTEFTRRGLLQYLAKSLNPEEQISTGAGSVPLVDFAGIKPKKLAPIPCKRVGWSQNIGASERKRAGWIDRANPHDLDCLLGNADDIRLFGATAGAKAASSARSGESPCRRPPTDPRSARQLQKPATLSAEPAPGTDGGRSTGTGRSPVETGLSPGNPHTQGPGEPGEPDRASASTMPRKTSQADIDLLREMVATGLIDPDEADLEIRGEYKGTWPVPPPRNLENELRADEVLRRLIAERS